MGATLGWTAPALPYLDEGLCGDDCDVTGITTDDASWIGAVLTLGALLSGPVSGKVCFAGGERVPEYLEKSLKGSTKSSFK